MKGRICPWRSVSLEAAEEDHRPGRVGFHPYGLVWSAEQDILMSQTESELDQIKGQFNLVNNFVSKIGGDTDL